MQVVAIMNFPYDGKDRKAGDRFEATPKDAEVLKIFGRIELVAEDEAPPPKRRRAYKRRDMTAEQ